MRKVFKSLLLIMVLSMFSIVKAEEEKIEVSSIISKFQAVSGYTVTSRTDGSSFSVNTGSENIEYTYSTNDNILSYNAGAGKEIKTVVEEDKILGYIVDLSSNKDAYLQVKASSSKTNGVDYGTGCDLAGMGFCYDSTSGNMQIVMSNKFTTFLYNYYAGDTINDPSSVQSVDPVVVDETPTSQDSKNPDTGSFTEIGIIIALLTLLLIVVNLKRRSETEFKI